jgi:hypothetical protein
MHTIEYDVRMARNLANPPPRLDEYYFVPQFEKTYAIYISAIKTAIICAVANAKFMALYPPLTLPNMMGLSNIIQALGIQHKLVLLKFTIYKEPMN